MFSDCYAEQMVDSSILRFRSMQISLAGRCLGSWRVNTSSLCRPQPWTTENNFDCMACIAELL